MKVKQNFKTGFKYLLLLIALFSFLNFIPTDALANESESEQQNTVSQPILDSLSDEQYGAFKGGNKNYYYIDAVTERDAKLAKTNSVWSDIKDTLFGWTDFSGNFMEKFNSMLLMFVNLFFKINLFLTGTLIAILDFSMEFDVVELIITEVSSHIVKITGFTGLGFNGGIFGMFLTTIFLIVALYMLYVFVVKRAFLQSFSELGKTIIVLVVAMAIFSNYTSFLIGANNIANEATKNVLTSVNTVSQNNSVNDTLWTMFVDRPYLTLQYGTYNIEEIGQSRVESILKTPYGEARQNKVLIDEVAKNNNELMVSSSILERLAFTMFYSGVNFIVAIPIGILAIVLITLQLWYVAIAVIAPFALLIALLPTSFGVMKRYFVELAIPLGLKVFFAAFTVIILFLSEILYGISATNFADKGLLGFIVVGLIQALVFFVIFLLRKRIMNIFSSGSTMIASMRDGASTANPLNAIKKATQLVAQAGGTAIGGITGGLAGAQVGNSLGKLVGKAATGDVGVSEAVDSSLRAGVQSQMLSTMNTRKKNGEPFELPEASRKELDRFMELNAIDDKGAKDAILDSIGQAQLKDVTYNELDTAYDEVMEQFNNGELKETNIGDALVNQIQTNRNDETANANLKSMEGLLNKHQDSKGKYQNANWEEYGEVKFSNKMPNLEGNEGEVPLDQEQFGSLYNNAAEEVFVGKNQSKYTKSANIHQPIELADKVNEHLLNNGVQNVSPKEIELAFNDIEKTATGTMSTNEIGEKIASGVMQRRKDMQNVGNGDSPNFSNNINTEPVFTQPTKDEIFNRHELKQHDEFVQMNEQTHVEQTNQNHKAISIEELEEFERINRTQNSEHQTTENLQQHSTSNLNNQSTVNEQFEQMNNVSTTETNNQIFNQVNNQQENLNNQSVVNEQNQTTVNRNETQQENLNTQSVVNEQKQSTVNRNEIKQENLNTQQVVNEQNQTTVNRNETQQENNVMQKNVNNTETTVTNQTMNQKENVVVNKSSSETNKENTPLMNGSIKMPRFTSIKSKKKDEE